MDAPVTEEQPPAAAPDEAAPDESVADEAVAATTDGPATAEGSAPDGSVPAEETACPSCGAPTHAGDQFCEACGADLTPAVVPTPAAPAAAEEDPTSTRTTLVAPPGSARSEAPTESLPALACPQCGGRFAEDGYCEQCGAPAPRERDHWVETPAGWVAGACDKGRRHQANEDAIAVGADPDAGSFAALVVCDGVSTALASDVASLAAARAARDVLVADRPAGALGDAERAEAWRARMSQAGKAAQLAAARTPAVGPGPEPGASSPPSCTFVAAVVDGDHALVGWVGDSRAYWLPDGGGGEQLSEDDSWAAAQIELGVPREQAEAMPHAHAITRWLGTDSPDPEPRTRELTLDKAGWLLVCSDGLWNYCSEADQLGALVARTSQEVGTAPADLALGLVRWANEQGGVDNISVVLARCDEAVATATGTGAGTGTAAGTATDAGSAGVDEA